MVKTAMMFVAILLGCSACGSDLDDELATLANQKAIWETAEPVSYEFQYRVLCFCSAETTGPFIVTVENRQITSVVRQDRNFEELLPVQASADFSIAVIFDDIKGALKQGAHSVTLEYDATWGFPSYVYIDRDEQIADEEWGVKITNFLVLN